MNFVFTLHDSAGNLIAPIPSTVKWTNSPFQGDPYTWERSPGSNVPFALGDGLWRERPVMQLSGATWDRSRRAVLELMRDQRAAVRAAHEVRMYGAHLAYLSADYPGAYEPIYSETVRSVTHHYTLNLTAPIDADALDGVIAALAALGDNGSVDWSGQLAQTLPYIWPAAGAPETYATAQTLDLAVALGHAIRTGVIENLGETEFEVVQQQGDVQHAPLTVPPGHSRELMPGITALTLTPSAGTSMRPQVEVQ